MAISTSSLGLESTVSAFYPTMDGPLPAFVNAGNMDETVPVATHPTSAPTTEMQEVTSYTWSGHLQTRYEIFCFPSLRRRWWIFDNHL